MPKPIEQMTRDEFKAHMEERVRRILEEARESDTAAAHWNREHPDEESLPTDAEQTMRDLLGGWIIREEALAKARKEVEGSTDQTTDHQCPPDCGGCSCMVDAPCAHCVGEHETAPEQAEVSL